MSKVALGCCVPIRVAAPVIVLSGETLPFAVRAKISIDGGKELVVTSSSLAASTAIDAGIVRLVAGPEITRVG
jgi:hypothetical protein